MRIDVLLHRCRFVRSRGGAQQLVVGGHLRRNGIRLGRASQAVAVGDILTLPLGKSVRVIEVLALPERRGPASQAGQCYRVLDPQGETALAAGNTAPAKGNLPP